MLCAVSNYTLIRFYCSLYLLNVEVGVIIMFTSRSSSSQKPQINNASFYLMHYCLPWNCVKLVITITKSQNNLAKQLLKGDFNALLVYFCSEIIRKV